MSQKVIPPSTEQILEMADSFGMNMTQQDAELYSRFIAPIAQQYDRLDELVEPLPEVKYPRTIGRAPTEEENPYRAWYWKSEIKGADKGLLAGIKVVIKDNICVAGIPMMNGTKILEGFVPNIDA